MKSRIVPLDDVLAELKQLAEEERAKALRAHNEHDYAEEHRHNERASTLYTAIVKIRDKFQSAPPPPPKIGK